MPFSLDHWRKPRKTIATRHQHDDIAYATHGALVAVECIKRLGISGSTASKMKLLDYGCGTGRMARVLAGYFGQVVAYDPVKECIAEGKKECSLIQGNLTYTDDIAQCSDRSFDVIVSVNVMEHLKPADQPVMLANIKRAGKPGARLLLWYSIRGNRQTIVDAFGGGFWVREDDDFMALNPSSTIQVRQFTIPG